MSDRITAESISITGAGGDSIEAYLAAPDEPTPRGSMVVLHHRPGYDRGTKEITRRVRRAGVQWNVGPIVDRAATLNCPLLGLFGGEDRYPSPADVEVLAQALKASNKVFEFNSFANAGHAFFSTDRPAYRPPAAVEGWELIGDFLARNLAA